MARRSAGRKASSPKETRWRRRRWWIAGGGAVVMVVLLSVLATSFSGPETSEPGIAAPDVTLATRDGQMRVSYLEGEVALLHFSFPG